MTLRNEMALFLLDFNEVQRGLIRSWSDRFESSAVTYQAKVLEFVDKTPRETAQYDALSSSQRDSLFRAVCDGIGLARSICYSSQFDSQVRKDSLLVICELFKLAAYLVSRDAAIPTDIPGLARVVREELSDQSVLRAVRELEDAYSFRELRGRRPRSYGGGDVCVMAKPRPQAVK